ncbi:MAG: hypothetical protein ACREPT_13395 [Rudaea sp.]
MRSIARIGTALLVAAALAACSSGKDSSAPPAQAATPANTAAPAIQAANPNVEANTTNLPSYPSLTSGAPRKLMKADLTLNDACQIYEAYSKDEPAAVIAWYRKALPGAVESTIVVAQVRDMKIPATDLAANGTDHATIMGWNAVSGKTRIDLWIDRAGAGCKAPGL